MSSGRRRWKGNRFMEGSSHEMFEGLPYIVQGLEALPLVLLVRYISGGRKANAKCRRATISHSFGSHELLVSIKTTKGSVKLGVAPKEGIFEEASRQIGEFLRSEKFSVTNVTPAQEKRGGTTVANGQTTRETAPLRVPVALPKDGGENKLFQDDDSDVNRKSPEEVAFEILFSTAVDQDPFEEDKCGNPIYNGRSITTPLIERGGFTPSLASRLIRSLKDADRIRRLGPGYGRWLIVISKDGEGAVSKEADGTRLSDKAPHPSYPASEDSVEQGYLQVPEKASPVVGATDGGAVTNEPYSIDEHLRALFTIGQEELAETIRRAIFDQGFSSLEKTTENGDDNLLRQMELLAERIQLVVQVMKREIDCARSTEFRNLLPYFRER